MATHAGNLGSVKIATDTVLEIDRWTLDFERNLTPTHSFSDTWEEHTATLGKWSGSFSGRVDQADTTGHVALRTAGLNGTTVALRLYTTATTYYSGSAFIKPSVEVAEDGLVTVSYSFTGSGALAYT